jgi:TupA-like ATPgrasp/Protein of unknown function (DUF707)
MVFTSAGDNTHFDDLWVSSEQIYDIYVYYYGDSVERYERYKSVAKFIERRKGSKFQNFHAFYLAHQDIVNQYDRFFIVDDDIVISSHNINSLFMLSDHYNLSICQPSFGKGSIISHKITKNRRNLLLQYTNFVEVNTPLFSRDALHITMGVYSPELIGWGIDYLYCWANGFEDNKIAVIHAIQCINPTTCSKGGIRELTKIPRVQNRRLIWEKYAASILCPKTFQIRSYSYIKLPVVNRMITCNFEKPPHWNRMPLYTKIRYSFPYFTAEFGPFIDKIEAKRIVKEMVGDLIDVAPIRRILSGPDDLQEGDLDPTCIIKASHASRRNINIRPNATYDVEFLREMLTEFSSSYYDYLQESQYKYVKPRFFVEEKIVDYCNGQTGNAITFMIYCIHGKPYTLIIMELEQDRYRHFDIGDDNTVKRMNIPGPIDHDFIVPNQEVLTRMFDVARILSKPFEFVRVDFYLGADGKLYFSEFTFTPHAGQKIYPDAIELRLGQAWT